MDCLKMHTDPTGKYFVLQIFLLRRLHHFYEMMFSA